MRTVVVVVSDDRHLFAFPSTASICIGQSTLCILWRPAWGKQLYPVVSWPSAIPRLCFRVLWRFLVFRGLDRGIFYMVCMAACARSSAAKHPIACFSWSNSLPLSWKRRSCFARSPETRN